MLVYLLLLSLALISFPDTGVCTLHRVPQTYSTIQEAINAAASGDTVLISAGTYFENILITKKLTLASSYIFTSDPSDIRNTIINGSFPIDSDTASTILIYGETDTTTVVCGLTITGGMGTKFTDGNWSGYLGGGICLLGGGMKVVNNIISGNIISRSLATEGGGLEIWPAKNELRYWIIERNIISGNILSCAASQGLNAAAAGAYLTGDGRFAHNIVTNNIATSQNTNSVGGGLFIHGGISDTSDILIKNNYFCGNSSKSAAIFASFMEMEGIQSIELVNNIFCGNNCTSTTSSLILIWNGLHRFVNNTLAENSGRYLLGYTGATDSLKTEVIFLNNIIWNPAAESELTPSRKIHRLYSNLIRGASPDSGNINL